MESHQDVRGSHSGANRSTSSTRTSAQRNPAEMLRQEARRKFEEAKNARRNATMEHIKKQGIVPDERDLVPEPEQEGPTRKNARIDNRGDVYKVFNQKTSPPASQETDTRMDMDETGTQSGKSNPPTKMASKPDINPRFREIQETYLLQQHQAVAEFNALIATLMAVETPPPKSNFDLLGSICTSADLTVEVCKHLRPADIVNLYSIAEDFHAVLNTFMQSCITVLARQMAPTAGRVCHPRVYPNVCINDPVGRPRDPAYHDMAYLSLGAQQKPITDTESRKVPGLKWLAMVHQREKHTRDIIATMARMGHRLAKNSQEMLLKLWLLMDIATNEGRLMVVGNRRLFTDQDLYNAQLFFIKLMLLFNNPLYGPQSPKLMYLFLGQHGLRPLWALLRRKQFTTEREIILAALRYEAEPTSAQIASALPVFGVPIYELGTVHLEGWGEGDDHLLRPDELVPIESVHRNLDIDSHIDFFLHFGHVDLLTGRNLAPSLEELYMSDDEYPWPDPDFDNSVDGGCGNVPFEPNMWLPRHARKARWGTLTRSERKEILRRDKAEIKEELTAGPTELSDVEEEVEVDLEQQKYGQRLARYRMLKSSLQAERKDKGKGKAVVIDNDNGSDEDGDVMDLDDEIVDFQKINKERIERLKKNAIMMPPTLARLQQRNSHGRNLQVPGAPGATSAMASRIISGPSVFGGAPPHPDSAFSSPRAASGPSQPAASQAGSFVPTPTSICTLPNTGPFMATGVAASSSSSSSSHSPGSSTDASGNYKLREAAESLLKTMDIDINDYDGSEGGSEGSSDRESDQGWQEETTTIPSLTNAERVALESEADQMYEDGDLTYPWEIMVRSSKLIQNMPLTNHELQAMGWRGNESHNGDGLDYVEDEEEKDPRLANPAQIVLQKEDEREGEEMMSDVDLDDEGLVIHLDGEEDEEEWDNEYDPEDYLWDPEIPGKNGFLRNYYRRY